MRQVAIDTAAIPKDARIAALEKNTVENEHLIAVARAEKMKQFEDMQQSQVGANFLTWCFFDFSLF